MVSERTLRAARMAAERLRDDGDLESADAITTLVAAVRDESVPTLDLLTTSQAGDLFGVSGQTIKNWVRRGRLAGYRVGGRIMIPKEAAAAYVQRARQALDLDEVSDGEAARLVAEGRQR